MNLINFILFSHIFIGFVASSLYIYSSLILKVPISINNFLFILFGTIFSYNLIEVFPKNNISPETTRGKYLESHLVEIKIIIVLTGIYSFYYFLKLNIVEQLFYFLLSFLVFIYEGNLNKKIKLRSIPYLKAFYISFVWMYAVTIPIILKTPLNSTLLLFLSEIFILILALTISFDLRDFDLDKSLGLKTLPNKLGPIFSKYFILVLFIVQGMLTLFINNQWQFMATFILNFSLLSYILKNIQSKNKDYWSYIGIDGIMALKLIPFAFI